MSRVDMRPLSPREWSVLEHMVDTGGWTRDDPPPFDTEDVPAIVMTLAHRGFCYVDSGRGGPEPYGSLIAPLGIAYHRWNKARWPRETKPSTRGPGWDGSTQR